MTANEIEALQIGDELCYTNDFINFKAFYKIEFIVRDTYNSFINFRCIKVSDTTNLKLGVVNGIHKSYPYSYLLLDNWTRSENTVAYISIYEKLREILR